MGSIVGPSNLLTSKTSTKSFNKLNLYVLENHDNFLVEVRTAFMDVSYNSA
jgi:hypothetical protein